MAGKPRFSHLGIFVSDLEAMEAFYTGVLGFLVTDRGLLGESSDLFVASAGASAPDGLRPTAETLAALAARGIDHDGVSKTLTAEMIRKADVVFCMTRGHVAAAGSLVGDNNEAQQKIMCLDPEADIEDPLGLDQSAYDSLAERFMTLIPRRLKGVFGDENRAGG